jgi:hypothetical protein
MFNTSEFLFITLSSICLISILLSYFLVKGYKATLIQGMGYHVLRNRKKTTQDAIEINQVVEPNFHFIDTKSMATSDGPLLYKMKETFGFHWFVYIFGCILFSAVVTICLYYDSRWNPDLKQFYFALFTFPIASISFMLLTVGWKQKLLIASIIGFFYLFFCFYLSDNHIPAGLAVLTYFQLNFFPICIISIVRIGKRKNVGLFIYSFLLFCLAGPIYLTYIFFYHTTYFTITNSLLNIFLGACFLLAAAGCLLHFGLKGVKRSYIHKWINDYQLNADAIVIIFNINYAIALYDVNPNVALFTLLAFPVYKLGTYFAFYFLRKRRIKQNSPTLLILRVFDLGDESKQFFERILRHWRYAGSTQMISGPDLALTTIEPHEIIAYIHGDLENNFCYDELSIKRNIASLDREPDIDSTHRVNELFCRNANWKQVLDLLAKKSDIVLMDIRRFSEKYQGCRYEVDALVRMVDLRKVLFIYDHRTDMTFTKTCFREALSNADSQSINRINMPNINLFHYHATKFNEEFKVLNLLCSMIE